MRTNLERKLYQYGNESRRMTEPERDADMLRLMERAKKYEPHNGMIAGYVVLASASLYRSTMRLTIMKMN